jgi:hypothetical protein
MGGLVHASLMDGVTHGLTLPAQVRKSRLVCLILAERHVHIVRGQAPQTRPRRYDGASTRRL